MSRIGKKPVALPSGVSAAMSGQTIEVKGPKGSRSFTASDDVTMTIDESSVSVTPRGNSKRARQQWGMSRTMVANLVTGVTSGFKKELEAVADKEERETLFAQLLEQMYEQGKATEAASHLEIDAVIDPADTRGVIVRAFDSRLN